MSRRKLPKYKKPKATDLSPLLYVDSEGDFLHRMFAYSPICGVFEWMYGSEYRQDFFAETEREEEDEDDDDDDGYYED